MKNVFLCWIDLLVLGFAFEMEFLESNLMETDVHKMNEGC